MNPPVQMDTIIYLFRELHAQVGFNIPLDTLQVILGTVFPASRLIGAKPIQRQLF